MGWMVGMVMRVQCNQIGEPNGGKIGSKIVIEICEKVCTRYVQASEHRAPNFEHCSEARQRKENEIIGSSKLLAYW